MQNLEKELILLVGPVGSGKTTFAKYLKNDVSIRVSQDEQGKSGHLAVFKDAIAEGVPRIILDRMNFNKEQRARYIVPAREAGYVITIFEMAIPFAICADRVMNRQNHPTVESNNQELAMKILDMYARKYEMVTSDECDNYNVVETSNELP